MVYNGIEMKQIPSFREGISYESYYITRTGDVYSFRYKKGHGVKKIRTNITNSGYLEVALYDKGKCHCEYIHRLVAIAYIPNPNHLPEVNHKDLNKLNNFDENLEWCTASENVRHAKRNCTRKTKTSSNPGVLYRDTESLGHFDSLQQAKIYCHQTFQCSLSTIGDRNENKQHHLVFIRDCQLDGFDIHAYWQNARRSESDFRRRTAVRIKAEKGMPGKLYQCGIFIGHCRSIREANSVLGIYIAKRKSGKYACRDYEYILDEIL